MKIVIAGSRGVRVSEGQICDTLLRAAWIGKVAEVMTGECPGSPDIDGAEWAERRASIGIRHVGFPAHWTRHGKRAGFVRNGEMAEAGDALLAFWDGRSPGTLDMIRRMHRLDKPVWVEMVRR